MFLPLGYYEDDCSNPQWLLDKSSESVWHVGHFPWSYMDCLTLHCSGECILLLQFYHQSLLLCYSNSCWQPWHSMLKPEDSWCFKGKEIVLVSYSILMVYFYFTLASILIFLSSYLILHRPLGTYDTCLGTSPLLSLVCLSIFYYLTPILVLFAGTMTIPSQNRSMLILTQNFHPTNPPPPESSTPRNYPPHEFFTPCVIHPTK